jgi:hypothetical protein
MSPKSPNEEKMKLQIESSVAHDSRFNEEVVELIARA